MHLFARANDTKIGCSRGAQCNTDRFLLVATSVETIKLKEMARENEDTVNK